MAKKVATRSARSNRGRPATSSRGRSNQVQQSRQVNTGGGRGRRPKSMEQYLLEDEYTEDQGDQDEFYQGLKQDADRVIDDEYYVDGRSNPRRHGGGNNQYTSNTGGGQSSRGGNNSRRTQVRDLVNNFANDLIEIIGG